MGSFLTRFRRLAPIVGILFIAVLAWLTATFVQSKMLSPNRTGDILRIVPEQLAIHARTGDIVDAKFDIFNLSNKEIKLFGVKSSCSCTAGLGFPASIPPGERRSVGLRIGVGKFSRGVPLVQTALVFSNLHEYIPPLEVLIHEEN